MANTYTQLYIQLVFAVKYRKSIIHETKREAVEKLITSIVTARSHKLLAIYCMPDHTHILIGLKPHQAISSLVRDIKSISSRLIKEESLSDQHFEWQSGFGAFSYRRSDLPQIISYILNQKAHHQKERFSTEYVKLLKEFDVEYTTEYLFDFLEEK